MKKYIILFGTVLLITSCNNQAPDAKSEREKDSLQVIINERDSSLGNFMASFKEIEMILDSINVKQGNINVKTEKPGDLKTSVRDEIKMEIREINNLIEKNRSNIAQLNLKLKTINSKDKALKDAIDGLNKLLSKKEGELTNLNSELTGLKFEIGELQASIGYLDSQNMEKDEVIAKDQAEIRKAYYIIGTSKELMDKKVIDKKGGLLGIGKVSEVNKNFDVSAFTPVDNTTATIFPVNSIKADIITSHPVSSYKWDKDKDKIKTLEITNPEEFWKGSKYLVIVIKP